MIKTCTECKQTKDCSEFYQDRKSPDGYRAKCKKCVNQKGTLYYQANSQKIGQWQKQYRSQNKNHIQEINLKRKQENKDKAITLLGGQCQRCGYDRCPDALDFHHLDPKEKDFTVSEQWGRNFESIKPEILKCQLLCAVCHREIHSTRCSPTTLQKEQ